jgi:hypothetical protein
MLLMISSVIYSPFPLTYRFHLFHHCTIIVLCSHLTLIMSPLYFVVAHSNNIVILLQKFNGTQKNYILPHDKKIMLPLYFVVAHSNIVTTWHI